MVVRRCHPLAWVPILFHLENVETRLQLVVFARCYVFALYDGPVIGKQLPVTGLGGPRSLDTAILHLLIHSRHPEKVDVTTKRFTN